MLSAGTCGRSGLVTSMRHAAPGGHTATAGAAPAGHAASTGPTLAAGAGGVIVLPRTW